MDSSHTIRDAVARVAYLRQLSLSDPDMATATKAVKRFQAERFVGTYLDLLSSPEYGGATQFFLTELYSDKDYAERDAQFARIAGALQTFFPKQVVATAVSLAELHVLTEELDHQMAVQWMQQVLTYRQGGLPDPGEVARYMQAWRVVGSSAARDRQLETVLAVGAELDRLTRTRGLRVMLKMMRRPAVSAGLDSLQRFLELGFDTFAAMSGNGARAMEFLNIIRQREAQWLRQLFDADADHCAVQLRLCLDNARTSNY
jgi:hypothetical protein